MTVGFVTAFVHAPGHLTTLGRNTACHYGDLLEQRQQVTSCCWRRSRCFSNKPSNGDDEEDNPVLFLIEKIQSTPLPSITIPGLNLSLSLGYPLALALTLLFVSPWTSLLLTILFVGFAYIGQQLVLGGRSKQEEEQGPVNLFAFVAAIFSTGFLAPDNGGSTSALTESSPDLLVQVVIGFVLVLAVGTIGPSLIPEDPKVLIDEDRLDKWDEQLREQQERKNGRDE